MVRTCSGCDVGISEATASQLRSCSIQYSTRRSVGLHPSVACGGTSLDTIAERQVREFQGGGEREGQLRRAALVAPLELLHER